MTVDGAVAKVSLLGIGGGDERVPAFDDTGGGDEGGENAELRHREAHRPTLDPRLEALRIELDARSRQRIYD
jgi:hypothetical protein